MLNEDSLKCADRVRTSLILLARYDLSVLHKFVRAGAVLFLDLHEVEVNLLVLALKSNDDLGLVIDVLLAFCIVVLVVEVRHKEAMYHGLSGVDVDCENIFNLTVRTSIVVRGVEESDLD